MVYAVVQELFSSVMVRALFFVLFSMWMKWLWDRRRFYYLSYKLPGPSSPPILGSTVELGCFSNHKKIMPRLKKMRDKYGGFFKLWFGPEFLLVITQPEDFESLLTNKATFNKGFMYDMVKYTVNEGLLGASGPIWKKHRHIINPAFAISTVKKYQSSHNFYAARMTESMKDIVDKGYVDVLVYTHRFVTDVICDSLFELKLDCYKGDNDEVLHALIKISEIVHERACKFWLQNSFVFEHSPLYKEYKKYHGIFTKFFRPILKKKFYEILENSNESDQKYQKLDSYDKLEEDFILEQDDNVKSRSALKVMAEAFVAGEMTEQHIIDEFDNIVMPGVDTSYTQMCGFILMMGMHKRVQDKLWNELKDFYAHDLDAEITRDHLNHLPYLDMCFKESMRLFPTGPMQVRRINEDIYMKNRDLVVPAGTQFLLLNIFLHKDEKFWKKPNEYYPERFLPKESAGRPHFAYIPFSIGLRNCIGQIFALDSLKIGLIHLLRNYEFIADPSWNLDEILTTADISLRSAFGYKVITKRRERNVQ